MEATSANRLHTQTSALSTHAAASQQMLHHTSAPPVRPQGPAPRGKRLPVVPEVVVVEAVLVHDLLHVLRDEREVVHREGGEHVVLDLVVEAAREEGGEHGAGGVVAGRRRLHLGEGLAVGFGRGVGMLEHVVDHDVVRRPC